MTENNANVTKGLKPEKLWRIFGEIASIPRPSKKEGKIRQYLIDFATKLNLKYKTDHVGNIVIYKDSQNSNSKKTVILQSHMDMVCENNPDVNIDFENDPITLVKDGEKLKAKGTTLGADNGIGLATSLAILEDMEIRHPALQVLVTVDEETGLTGALELDPSMLNGEYLINLDTEESGQVYIGCAGGENTEIIYEIDKEPLQMNSSVITISIEGLRGGHSGMDINSNLGNSIKFGAFLISLLIKEGIEFNIIKINGGKAHNAIPRNAEFIFAVDKKDKDKSINLIKNDISKIVDEYKNGTEPDIKISVFEEQIQYKDAVNKNQSKNIIMGLNNVHSGVYRMSNVVQGLVETSNNLSLIKHKNSKIHITSSTRSSNMLDMDMVTQMIYTQFKSANASSIESKGRYPGWTPIPIDKNPMLRKYIEVHKKVEGKEPGIRAVHAGLECGVLSEKLRGTQIISIGPDIRNPHSPNEYVDIYSVKSYWDILITFLKEL